MIGLVKQTLPCAEKGCKSKMTLTENTDNLLYYNCVKNHEKHAFRYNIEQKKWEKVILKTQRIFNYTENPCEDNQQSLVTDVADELENIADQAQTKVILTQN